MERQNNRYCRSTRTHYSDSEPTSLVVLSPYCCVPSGEATNVNFIVSNRPPRFEPMIYHTLDEHANHYITDAVGRGIFLAGVNTSFYSCNVCDNFIEWSPHRCISQKRCTTLYRIHGSK